MNVMKRFCVGIIVLVQMFFVDSLSAQRTEENVYAEMIEPVVIEATFDQTTNLIFPFAIKSVDWGNSGIIVQQRKGVKNILHVKAAAVHFVPTNLSVVTSDGVFYSFMVYYVTDPESLSYRISRERVTAMADLPVNEETMQSAALRVRAAPTFLHVSKRSQSANLGLTGVYLEQSALWFKFSLDNHSVIDFPVEYVRFFVKDRKAGKRTVVQEKEMIPIYAEAIPPVGGHQTADMLFAFDPFTIPKGKRLVVQIGEQGSGRFLQLRLKGKRILQAKKILRVAAHVADEAYGEWK
jgi:conjugative transposon TraN protein